MSEPMSFTERLAKLQAEKAAAGKPLAAPPVTPPPTFTPPVPTQYQESVPDVLGERSPEDEELDRVLDGVDILTAYTKWCGKMTPDPRGKTEGIKISCPNPAHPDRDPSAWINTEKQTWYCGGCDQGGDKYDIAALSFGYPIPAYKDGQLFTKLRQQMAESFGYHFKQTPGGTVMWRDEQAAPESPISPIGAGQPKPAQLDPADMLEARSPDLGPSSISAAETQTSDTPEQSDEQDAQPKQDEAAPLATVTPLYDDEPEEKVIYPPIHWRDFVPHDTFLREYLESTSNDNSPEEFHFWHGLLALGHAVGRNVTMDDTRPVYSNLMVCLLGATGTGKSRSREWLDVVIHQVMPFKVDGMGTMGTMTAAVPGSGEALVKLFSYEGKDPTNIKVSLGYQPVNGIVDFDELAALMTRANRQGSTLKPTLMAFADTRNKVASISLGSGEIVAEKPFCSVTASTQPKALRDILRGGDAASGFLNRWVLAGGVPKEREVVGGSRSSIRVNLDAAVEQLKFVRGWGGVERNLMLDDEGYAELSRFFKTKVFPAQEADDTDLLKRLDLLFKKLVLLFAINERSNEITASHVRMAKKLFDYVLACYGILDANMGITLTMELTDKIVDFVSTHSAKTSRAPSARDIQRKLGNKIDINQLRRMLADLVALDMIEEVKPPPGQVGRPTVRYKVVNS